jgi:hypothetical protein
MVQLEKWFNRAKDVTSKHGTFSFRLPASCDSDMLYRKLFVDEPSFYKKITLFRGPYPGMIPQMFAWYIWRHGYGGCPILYYSEERKIKDKIQEAASAQVVATS